MIGYSYWGFLADIKLNSSYEKISTPDGNAFYSWSIIKELQKSTDVISIMPDRDKYAVEKLGLVAFDAWATVDRLCAYSAMKHIEYNLDLHTCSEEDIFTIFDAYHIDKLEYILHEWRMVINGRNTLDCRNDQTWQPDLFLQNCILKYCKSHNVKLLIFDLDYKLEETDIADYADIVTILELGDKWRHSNLKSKKVYIPFDFSHINDFSVASSLHRPCNLIYIGNRYERDWCIDKYIPYGFPAVVIHGNWTENGRDSEDKWPMLDFRHRLQTSEMHAAYATSICTILLAKKEYCQYHFMTARIIEAIFYGTLPLFIEEYGKAVISEFAGEYADMLTVSSSDDVVNKIKYFGMHENEYDLILKYLRDRLKMMDASNFIGEINDIL